MLFCILESRGGANAESCRNIIHFAKMTEGLNKAFDYILSPLFNHYLILLLMMIKQLSLIFA